MKRISLFTAIFTWALSAAAGPDCGVKPYERWLDQAEFQKNIAKTITIAKFKITKGNCYEIYGKDSAGKDVEIYYNPVTGKEVSPFLK